MSSCELVLQSLGLPDDWRRWCPSDNNDDTSKIYHVEADDLSTAAVAGKAVLEEMAQTQGARTAAQASSRGVRAIGFSTEAANAAASQTARQAARSWGGELLLGALSSVGLALMFIELKNCAPQVDERSAGNSEEKKAAGPARPPHVPQVALDAEPAPQLTVGSTGGSNGRRSASPSPSVLPLRDERTGENSVFGPPGFTLSAGGQGKPTSIQEMRAAQKKAATRLPEEQRQALRKSIDADEARLADPTLDDPWEMAGLEASIARCQRLLEADSVEGERPRAGNPSRGVTQEALRLEYLQLSRAAAASPETPNKARAKRMQELRDLIDFDLPSERQRPRLASLTADRNRLRELRAKAPHDADLALKAKRNWEHLNQATTMSHHPFEQPLRRSQRALLTLRVSNLQQQIDKLTQRQASATGLLAEGLAWRIHVARHHLGQLHDALAGNSSRIDLTSAERFGHVGRGNRQSVLQGYVDLCLALDAATDAQRPQLEARLGLELQLLGGEPQASGEATIEPDQLAQVAASTRPNHWRGPDRRSSLLHEIKAMRQDIEQKTARRARLPEEIKLASSDKENRSLKQEQYHLGRRLDDLRRRLLYKEKQLGLPLPEQAREALPAHREAIAQAKARLAQRPDDKLERVALEALLRWNKASLAWLERRAAAATSQPAETPLDTRTVKEVLRDTLYLRYLELKRAAEATTDLVESQDCEQRLNALRDLDWLWGAPKPKRKR